MENEYCPVTLNIKCGDAPWLGSLAVKIAVARSTCDLNFGRRETSVKTSVINICRTSAMNIVYNAPYKSPVYDPT